MSNNDTTIYKVNHNVVNVRKNSSKTSEKIGELYSGESVEVYSIRNNFAKIKYDNLTAYVYADFLKKSFGDYIVTAKSVAYLRSSPSSSSKNNIIKNISRNSTVKVYKIENNWAYVDFASKRGYLFFNNLALKTTYYEVTASALDIRKMPSPNSKLLGTIEKGQIVDVVSLGENYTKIKYNNLTAYVKHINLKKLNIDRSNEDNISGTYYTNVEKNLPIRKDALYSSAQIDVLKNDEKVEVIDVKKVDKKLWAKIKYADKEGWCFFDRLSKVKSTASMEEKLNAMMIVAKEQLGKTYEMGSVGVDTFDCSGLTRYIYNKGARIYLERISYNQAKYGTVLYWDTVDETEQMKKIIEEKVKSGELNFETKVENVNLKFGDLLFFNTSNARVEGINHVGMYIGNNKFIHSPHENDVVRINNMPDDFTKKTLRKIVRMF